MPDDTRGSQPEPVQFRSRRDVALMTTALRDRAAVLEKLADKTEGEGYSREARTQRADAAAITDVIIPSLRDQLELPNVTTQQLRAGIANALRDVVHKSLVVTAPEDRQVDALKSRETDLLDALALRIEGYVREVASESYRAGFEARESEPEAIAHRMLESLQSAWT